jgi:hypothetical protein
VGNFAGQPHVFFYWVNAVKKVHAVVLELELTKAPGRSKIEKLVIFGAFIL